MAPNTKARNQALQDAARRILQSHDLNTSATTPHLIAAMMTEMSCHRDTAKRHLSQAARRMRHEAALGEPPAQNWGGARGGGGGWPKGKLRGGWKLRRKPPDK